MQLRMYLFLPGFLAVTVAQTCEDLVDFCDALQPICIGSIIQYQLQQLQAVADQLSNSTSIPALESSLPLLRSEDPNSQPMVGSVASSSEMEELEQEFKDSLPFLKESLPLIRESLPLIRESLPLIRHIIDPIYYKDDKTTCQRKATCKSKTLIQNLKQIPYFNMVATKMVKYTIILAFATGCRECPKLREAVANVVEAICPNTCRACSTGNNGTFYYFLLWKTISVQVPRIAAATLVEFYL
ncbi:unnamed protein product [Strongylus vulgaris]|uniref:ShKT domain-containing protein n=1 Tax=Strongylus vulgaris TaxID=40348 RepID=A0A3P7JEG9_STRVU|nr:unnamed protein product [Strongylus vulgaris]